jgi:hypothetical protein
MEWCRANPRGGSRWPADAAFPGLPCVDARRRDFRQARSISPQALLTRTTIASCAGPLTSRRRASPWCGSTAASCTSPRVSSSSRPSPDWSRCGPRFATRPGGQSTSDVAARAPRRRAVVRQDPGPGAERSAGPHRQPGHVAGSTPALAGGAARQVAERCRARGSAPGAGAARRHGGADRRRGVRGVRRRHVAEC